MDEPCPRIRLKFSKSVPLAIRTAIMYVAGYVLYSYIMWLTIFVDSSGNIDFQVGPYFTVHSVFSATGRGWEYGTPSAALLGDYISILQSL